MSESSFITTLYARNLSKQLRFPDKQSCIDFMEHVFHFLFIPGKSRPATKECLQRDYENLRNAFSGLLYDVIQDEVAVEKNTEKFFSTFPDLYEQLLKDAAAIVFFDPAASSIEEVFIAYPGFFATVVYRLSHQLYKQEIPTLPRLLAEYAHSKTGIDIHPGAVIGESFFIDHGTGIVVGETAIIGNNVKIYQGVTLGALSVSKQLTKAKRHPTVEDNVIIYSGATILGDQTVIGHDSIIGGNVWLTHGVEPYSVVYQKSEVVIRDSFTANEALNFII